MQVFFEGVLRAVLADGRIGGIALILIFCIVAVAHRAGVAKDVRGSRSCVFTDVGFLDIYTLNVVFAQRGYELHIRILDENIVRGIYEISHVYSIAHAGDDPRLFGGVVAVDIIALAHTREYLDGACVFLDFVCFHISVKPRLILLADVFKLERRTFRYRQIVDVIVAVIADHVDKL